MSTVSDLIDWALGNDGRHEAPLDRRPEPVLDEAKAKAKAAAGIASLVTVLGAFGVSATDAGFLGFALTLIAGAIIAVANAVLTLRAAYAARPLVTPLGDPRGPRGEQLVPAADTTSTGSPAEEDQRWALADDDPSPS